MHNLKLQQKSIHIVTHSPLLLVDRACNYIIPFLVTIFQILPYQSRFNPLNHPPCPSPLHNVIAISNFSYHPNVTMVSFAFIQISPCELQNEICLQENTLMPNLRHISSCKETGGCPQISGKMDSFLFLSIQK